MIWNVHTRVSLSGLIRQSMDPRVKPEDDKIKIQRRLFQSVFSLVLAIGLFVPATASLAETLDKAVILELNRLDTNGESCQLTVLAKNETERSVASVVPELVLIDSEGKVQQFLRVRLRNLTPGSMRAQRFNADGASCDKLGRILLNDITECESDFATLDACRAAIKATSLLEVPFE
jgi:hypothetical protein